jgi:hypothetical protein
MKPVRLAPEAVSELAEAAMWYESREPFALVFTELPTEVRILAIAHAKRRPGYWLYRVAH